MTETVGTYRWFKLGSSNFDMLEIRQTLYMYHMSFMAKLGGRPYSKQPL